MAMNAYSKDLRLKVLDAVERGVPRREVSELLGISLSTISPYVKLKASGRERAPRSPLRGARRRSLPASPTRGRSGARYRRERHRHFGRASPDVREGAGGLCLRGYHESRALSKKAGVDFQKRSMASSETDEQRRSAFAQYVRTIVSER